MYAQPYPAPALRFVDGLLAISELSAEVWADSAPARRKARIYGRAAWVGAQAAAPAFGRAAIALALAFVGMAVMAFQRGQEFRAWCDELVAAAEAVEAVEPVADEAVDGAAIAVPMTDDDDAELEQAVMDLVAAQANTNKALAGITALADECRASVARRQRRQRK